MLPPATVAHWNEKVTGTPSTSAIPAVSAVTGTDSVGEVSLIVGAPVAGVLSIASPVTAIVVGRPPAMFTVSVAS